MTRSLLLVACGALTACGHRTSPPPIRRAASPPLKAEAPSARDGGATAASAKRLAALRANPSPLTRGLREVREVAEACGVTTLAAAEEPWCVLVAFEGDAWLEATLRERGSQPPLGERAEGLRGTVGPLGPVCVAAGVPLELRVTRLGDAGGCGASVLVYRSPRGG